MNRTAASLLVAGSVALVAGCALFSPRAAVLLLGLLLCMIGLLSLDTDAGGDDQ